MAKGAGMLAPRLATMLVVLTTDARGRRRDLDGALRAATRVTFDRLDSDGCMSTNDTVPLLASGASGIAPTEEEFTAALTEACTDLAMQLLADAEGADHDIAIEVLNAATEDDAVEVGRAVARSNLFKTAIFGNDPNWGRVLAAVGTTAAAFDPDDLDVAINGVWVCRGRRAGRGPRPAVDLSRREVHVTHRPEGRRRRAPPSGPTTSRTTTSTRTARTRHDDTRRRLDAVALDWKRAAAKAATLIEALPWLKRYHGETSS